MEGAACGEHAPAAKKARDFVSFANKSSQTLEKFLKTQKALDSCKEKPEDVATDVVTRWWATRDIAEHLLVIEPAVKVTEEDRQFGNLERLEESDWNNLEITMSVLLPCKEGQEAMECSNHVTASLVAHAAKRIRERLTNLACAEEDSVGKTSATHFLADFECQWRTATAATFDDTVERGIGNCQKGVHPALLTAQLLGPRFKSLPFVPGAESKVATKEPVLEIVIQSNSEHRQNTNPSPAAVAVAAVHAPAARANNLLAGIADMVAAAEEGLEQAEGSFNSVAEICNDELKRHIKAKSQDFQFKTGKKDSEGEDILGYNDPLDWWKEFQNLCPILARLAKIYLSVQASSAALEKVFSLSLIHI